MAGSSDGWKTDAIEKELQSMIRDGCLSDLVEVDERTLKNPLSIAPFRHLPFKLYESPTATRVLTTLLDNVVPGTPATYNQILSEIMCQTHTDSFCYLIGGQVRDILRGKVSKDVDFNYACSAKDVALVCVNHEWTVKYKMIGPCEKPNYILIGDEQTDQYMEGFSISFNATSECFKQDFRQNLLFYDLTNHVILDKSGYGVADIRNCELRLSCAPSGNFEEWAVADMTLGQKALRYVKFVVRSDVRRTPLKVDKDESAFVANLLKRAFRENADAFHGFWFGYVLGECLSSETALRSLHKWVCDQGGPTWWQDWLPFVECKVADSAWLDSLMPAVNAECAADTIKHIFERSDHCGDGLISQGDLKKVMLSLGSDLSEQDLDVLFDAVQFNSAGKVKYDDFIDLLLGFPLS